MERICSCGSPYVKKRPKASNKCLICIQKEINAWKAKNPQNARQAKSRAKAKNIEKFKADRAAEARRRKIRISTGQGTVMDFMRLLVARAKHQLKRRTHPVPVNGINPRLLAGLWESQAGLCALSKMPMVLDKRNLRSVSLDRIDSRDGYTPNNVQLVCKWANFAKNSHTNAEFLQLLSDYELLLSKRPTSG